MAKKTIKYWLVEVTRQKVYEFFKGQKQVTANDLNDLSGFAKKLNEDNPSDWWSICTNECPTKFVDFGVKFVNGRFESI